MAYTCASKPGTKYLNSVAYNGARGHAELTIVRVDVERKR